MRLRSAGSGWLVRCTDGLRGSFPLLEQARTFAHGHMGWLRKHKDPAASCLVLPAEPMAFGVQSRDGRRWRYV